MTTSSISSLVIRAPQVSTRNRDLFTSAPRAIRTIDAIKSVYHGRQKAVPVRGESRSAKSRKLDAFDCLAMDVHELAAVLADSTPEDAIFILERLTEDSAKDEVIALQLAAVKRAPSLIVGEAEAAVAIGAFLCELDKHSDARLIQNKYVGAVARMRSAMLAQESQ